MTVELLTRFDNFHHKWENEREPGKLLQPNTIEVHFNILRPMHISQHALAHIAQEAGAESSAIKIFSGIAILPQPSDIWVASTHQKPTILYELFSKRNLRPRRHEIESSLSKEEKAIELLKGMTPEQIMAVISAINK